MRTRYLAHIVCLQIVTQTLADVEMEIGCLWIQKKGKLDFVRVPGVEIEQVYEQGNLAGRKNCLPKLPPTGRMQIKYLSKFVQRTLTIGDRQYFGLR